jgi:hypothetical protein
MVKIWSGRVARWGILGLTALIVVVYFGSLFLTLSHRVKVAEAARAQDDTALAVAKTKIADLTTAAANLHVMVTAPAPSVTVTVAPGAIPGVSSSSSTRVVTVPSLFAVPGVTPTVVVPSAKPPTVTVQNCPVLHLLILCL